jgi:hypothetical protein
MSDLLNIKCETCKSGRSMPRPPYPVKIQHVCDMVEPGRAFWAMVPEDYEAPTGALR